MNILNLLLQYLRNFGLHKEINVCYSNYVLVQTYKFQETIES